MFCGDVDGVEGILGVDGVKSKVAITVGEVASGSEFGEFFYRGSGVVWKIFLIKDHMV